MTIRQLSPSRLYTVVDVVATALFGVEGALAGAAAGLDVFGILVVGFATALVGGVIRDLLLGDIPPAAFRSPLRIIVALAGSAAAFVFYAAFQSVPPASLTVLDAAALALFAVSGADKALANRANGWVVVMLGTMTAVGGGVVRDILLNRVPVVLTASVYATAAAAGAVVMLVATRLGVPRIIAMTAGVVVCFGLRLLAVAFGWHLPHV